MSTPAAADPGSTRRPIRWWPVPLILLGGLARLAWVWQRHGGERQVQVMGTGAVILVVLALLLLWVMFFSRLRWRVRWLVLAAVVALPALAAALFRFDGVTGDLVPILRFRWANRSAPTPTPAPTPSVAGTRSPAASNPATAAVPASGPAAPAFPQFLGPNRDGVIAGVRLATDWQAQPPTLLWRKPVGSGWGGFAIVGDRALTQEQDGAEERVVCYDAVTGQERWQQRSPARYDNPVGGIGPRATPTVAGGRVFTLGATGWLNCLELETGRVLWSTNVTGFPPRPVADLSWGLSSSPLLYSNLVVVAPLGSTNGSLTAFRADTGERVWSGGTAGPHYSSARLETVRGVPQLLTFTSHGPAGHDPATGELLWEYSWRGGHPHVTDPRVVDDARGLVLVSSGYGTGSQLLELNREADGRWAAPRQVWRSMRLKSKFANLILRGDSAYGLDDGRLVCLNLADGERRWDGERYGHGQLLLVGDLLLITAESGGIVLVDAAPDAFRERAKIPALSGKTWNPPALAGDLLIVRNDAEAAAFRLPLSR